MIHDLRHILDGWEYEPGKISVRKIVGRDGREKIQTRVDLGVLQFEMQGRPDGAKPFGCDSLLAYFEKRQRTHEERNPDSEFVLSSDDCRELRAEAHLLYQRYLSLFVLEEYEAVERDTAENLRLIEFCAEHGAYDTDREALLPQRSYVQMMHTRARAYRAMNYDNSQLALTLARNGLARFDQIAGEYRDRCWYDEQQISAERRVLEELVEELFDTLPEDSPAFLERQIERAIAAEDYEHAAELRDQLDALLDMPLDA